VYAGTDQQWSRVRFIFLCLCSKYPYLTVHYNNPQYNQCNRGLLLSEANSVLLWLHTLGWLCELLRLYLCDILLFT
jgi:hypothetical protein